MLVLLNPHKNHLYGNVKQRIDQGLKNISKLNFFLKTFIMVSNTRYLIDRQFFPETPKSLKFFFKSIFFQNYLLKEWQIMNGIKNQKSIITWDKLTKNDTIILNAKDLRYKNIGKRLEKTSVNKLILLSNHYGTHPSAEYEALSKFKGKINLISEVSMRERPLIKDYLPMIESEYTFGYCINEKFKCDKIFSNRKERAIAVGTINLDLPKNNESLRKYLVDNDLDNNHHYRTKLYNYSKNSKLIDTLFNVRHKHQISKKKNEILTKNYHTYDLNELYNSYKLAIILPDSLKTVPQLIFEALGSGTVVVTMYDKGLEQLGILKDVHYVAYDFNQKLDNFDIFLKNLLKKKNYLQKIHEEALKISKNFRKKNITNKLKSFLESI